MEGVAIDRLWRVTDAVEGMLQDDVQAAADEAEAASYSFDVGGGGVGGEADEG